MPALSDDELAVWRAKRTGKSVPAAPAGGSDDRNPSAPRAARSPLDGFADPGANIDDDDKDLPPSDPPSGSAGLAPEDELRAQLAAANGRLGPVQRQLEELRSANEAAQRQMAELQTQLAEQHARDAMEKAKQAANAFDPFEGMSKDEIDMLDPSAAELIKRAARNAYAKAASAIKDPEALINEALAKRDARSRDNYIRATADSLGLVKLTGDVKFNKFLTEDDSASILLNSFVQSPDLDTARNLEPRLRQMLKRYEKSTTSSSRAADPQDRLSAHLDRSGASHPNRQSISPEEAKQLRNEAARLTRARRFKEADAILAKLNA